MKPLHLLFAISTMPMSVAALYGLISPTPTLSSKARPLCEANYWMGVIQEAVGVIIVSSMTAIATVIAMITPVITQNLKSQMLSCQLYPPVCPSLLGRLH